MAQLTITQRMQLQSSYYPTADEVKDHYCLLCDDQVTAGFLVRRYAVGFVHTECLVGTSLVPQLWAQLQREVTR